MITFVNKRACGCTTEGFGEYQTRWNDYEIFCPDCKQWKKNYGDVSRSVTNDPEGEHEWICDDCAKLLPE